MPSKTEKYEIYFKRLEKGKEKPLKVVFENKAGSEYVLEMGREYFNYFFPGEEYTGVFNVNGILDFNGKEACTQNYSLEKILKEGTIIFEK